MTTEIGLRERKKRRTRQLIADAAWRLFLERGFEGVSVAEIARAAEVSEATVFNYFRTKEDLVFGGLAGFEEEMLAAVRARPAGTSIADAFGTFVTEPRGVLAAGEPEAQRTIADATRLIRGSPALTARERELWDRYTTRLAALIAEEGRVARNDIDAWVTANALIGVQRALVEDVRGQVLAGVDSRTIARRVRARGRRALRLLESGLASTRGSES